MENKPVVGSLRKKRKYGKLTLDQKVQIIRAAEMGYSQRTLASQYNCGKTQVHLLVTQKELWLSKWERTRKGESWSRSRRSPTVSEINSLVWDFYKKACNNEVDITVNILLERAKQVAQALNAHNFNADLRWFEKFKKEFNITLPLPARVQGLSTNNVLSKELVDPLLKGYDKCNVYYLGVAELYHRTLPCIGQNNQDHITLCFCVGASGDKQIISLVFEENACVESELWNVTVPCFSSPMGQVTFEVYQHSLDILNQKMRQADRKICLYVDYSHFPSEIEKLMSNIDIYEWTGTFNVQEIINNYRLLYCQRLMTSLAASSPDQWNNLAAKVKSYPMSKVMRLVLSSWRQVSSKVIESSFISDPNTYNQDLQCQDINKKLLDKIQKLVLLFQYSNDNAGTSHPKNLSSIAEEIFSLVPPESINEERDKQGEDNGLEVESNEVSEAVTPLLKTDVFPTILKLEMLIQSMPDCGKRQHALEQLDTLEMSLQELFITEKTESTDSLKKVLSECDLNPL